MICHGTGLPQYGKYATMAPSFTTDIGLPILGGASGKQADEEVDSLLDDTDAMTTVGDAMDDDGSDMHISKAAARAQRAQVQVSLS